MIRSSSAILNPFSGIVKPFLVRKAAKDYSVSTSKLTSSPQLNEYQHYLTKHNQSLKKPHPKLQEAESKVISQLLQQKRYSPVISFLSNNTNLRLCNLTTTPTVDKLLASQYSELDQNDRVSAAFALVSFRQTSFFHIFREALQSKVQQGDIESVSIEQLIVYLFGQLIVHKSIRFISKLQVNNSNVTLGSLHQRLIHSNYKGTYIKQCVAVTQYISLLLNPQNNKIEELSAPPKKKSLLEIDVGAFLQVLGYSHRDQMTVNNFKVDFVVEKKEDRSKRVALQVNGNYHYTLSGKTKGRQIIRNLIVNQGLPLRIVHHQDFLLSRGHRNKQAYIQKLLHQSEVNWECRHQGMDSGWQVTETQNL